MEVKQLGMGKIGCGKCGYQFEGSYIHSHDCLDVINKVKIAELEERIKKLEEKG